VLVCRKAHGGGGIGHSEVVLHHTIYSVREAPCEVEGKMADLYPSLFAILACISGLRVWFSWTIVQVWQVCWVFVLYQNFRVLIDPCESSALGHHFSFATPSPPMAHEPVDVLSSISAVWTWDGPSNCHGANILGYVAGGEWFLPCARSHVGQNWIFLWVLIF
jgi:hypothetical protein